MEIVLRDYQQQCVDLVINAYKVNKSDKIYIVLPCGAGKTIIFSYITYTLAREYGSVATIIVAHREELLDQAAEKYRFVDTHAQNLAYFFNDIGIPAACITGNTPMDERKKLYAQLATGEIRVLTSVMVLSEGFDETSVSCVIMARPIQSRALYVQCLGRMLRLHPGKQDALLLDITDNCLIHRLSPMNLQKSIGVWMKEDETLLEAIERKEKEAEEARTARVRKLKEQRPKDIYIDLLQKLEWENLPHGGWRIIVGSQQHRVAIIPRKGLDDQFYVVAKLAPNFERQKWSDALSLEECQQIAEKKILTLH